MSQLTAEHIPHWVIRRMLAFFNRSQTAEEIVERVQDNPDKGGEGGYSMGKTVAQRILDKKESLFPIYFQTFDQLNGIEGLGQDKIDDLAYTFRLTAEAQFVENLNTNFQLEDNFDVLHYTRKYTDDEEFTAIQRNPAILRKEVGEMLVEIAARDFNNSSLSKLARHLVSEAYVDTYHHTEIAKYVWAVWFYAIAFDDWFSFDQIQGEIEQYLNEYWGPGGDITFSIFRGAQAYNVWGETDDLPISLNTTELSLTLWQVRTN